MITIKLMADYGCYPLWKASPGEVGNINPDDLPISDGIKQRLSVWADEYDATLDRDDPIRSGFPSADAEAKFKRTGEALARELRLELGDTFTVITKSTSARG